LGGKKGGENGYYKRVNRKIPKINEKWGPGGNSRNKSTHCGHWDHQMTRNISEYGHTNDHHPVAASRGKLSTDQRGRILGSPRGWGCCDAWETQDSRSVRRNSKQGSTTWSEKQHLQRQGERKNALGKDLCDGDRPQPPERSIPVRKGANRREKRENKKKNQRVALDIV